MIQTMQNLIWNIGGFLFSLLLIVVILVAMLNWIINWASWWFDKGIRKNLFYWIKNKKRINEIIEKEKKTK